MPRGYRKKHWPEEWVPPKKHVPEVLEKEHVKRLLEWMDSMVEWGKNVRDDIIRLESSLGVAAGDPGDPPPTPWREDEEEEEEQPG
jgi:hypothetical protein